MDIYFGYEMMEFLHAENEQPPTWVIGSSQRCTVGFVHVCDSYPSLSG